MEAIVKRTIDEIRQLRDEQDQKLQRLVEQMQLEKNVLVRRVGELNQSLLVEKEQKMAPIVEYARQIGVPIVADLQGKYSRLNMLQLIKHGNAINPLLYVPRNYNWHDNGLLQAIVDELASAVKPGDMIEQVLIEPSYYGKLEWPESDALQLRQVKPNMDMKYEEASGFVEIRSNCYNMAEYGLVNNIKGCQFNVHIYYKEEEEYGRFVAKMFYRRLA